MKLLSYLFLIRIEHVINKYVLEHGYLDSVVFSYFDVQSPSQYLELSNVSKTIRLRRVLLTSYNNIKSLKMAHGNDGGALRGLVDSGASCGTVNPLMKLTTHYSKDRARQDDGITFRRPASQLKPKGQNNG